MLNLPGPLPTGAPENALHTGTETDTPTGVTSDPVPAAGAEPAGRDPGPVVARDRVASLIEVVLCSGFPSQLLVTLSLAAVGLTALSPSGELSLSYIAWLSVIDTVLLLALILLFLRARGERARVVFLGARPVAGEIWVGALLVPGAFLIVVALALFIEQAAPWLRDPGGNPLAALLKTNADVVTLAFVAVLAGGLREELQRAFILHRFERHLGGAPVGLLLFSTAFGLGHALQGWDAAIMTGWLGAFWGVAYLWRRSIIAPAVCHAAFNLIEVVYHGLVS